MLSPSAVHGGYNTITLNTRQSLRTVTRTKTEILSKSRSRILFEYEYSYDSVRSGQV